MTMHEQLRDLIRQATLTGWAFHTLSPKEHLCVAVRRWAREPNERTEYIAWLNGFELTLEEVNLLFAPAEEERRAA